MAASSSLPNSQSSSSSHPSSSSSSSSSSNPYARKFGPELSLNKGGEVSVSSSSSSSAIPKKKLGPSLPTLETQLTFLASEPEGKFDVNLTVEKFYPHLARALVDPNYIPVCAMLLQTGVHYEKFHDIELMCQMAVALPKLKDLIILHLLQWINLQTYEGLQTRDDYPLVKLFKAQPTAKVSSVLAEIYGLCNNSDNYKMYMEMLSRIFKNNFQYFALVAGNLIKEMAKTDFPLAKDSDFIDLEWIRLSSEIFYGYVIGSAGKISADLYELVARFKEAITTLEALNDNLVGKRISYSHSVISCLPKNKIENNSADFANFIKFINIERRHFNEIINEIKRYLITIENEFRLKIAKTNCFTHPELAEVFLYEMTKSDSNLSVSDATKHAEYLLARYHQLQEGLGQSLSQADRECITQCAELLGKEGFAGRKPIQNNAIEFVVILLNQFFHTFQKTAKYPLHIIPLDKSLFADGEGMMLAIMFNAVQECKKIQSESRLWVMLSETVYVTPQGQKALGELSLTFLDSIFKRAEEVLCVPEVCESKDEAGPAAVPAHAADDVVHEPENAEEALAIEREKRLNVTPALLQNFMQNIPHIISLWPADKRFIIFNKLLNMFDELFKLQATPIDDKTPVNLALFALPANAAAAAIALLGFVADASQCRSANIEEILSRTAMLEALTHKLLRSENAEEFRLGCQIVQLLSKIFPNLEGYKLDFSEMILALKINAGTAKVLPLLAPFLTIDQAEHVLRAGLVALKEAQLQDILVFCRDLISNASNHDKERHALIDIVLQEVNTPQMLCQLAGMMDIARLKMAFDALVKQGVTEEILNDFMSKIPLAHQKALVTHYLTKDKTTAALRMIAVCYANIEKNKKLAKPTDVKKALHNIFSAEQKNAEPLKENNASLQEREVESSSSSDDGADLQNVADLPVKLREMIVGYDGRSGVRPILSTMFAPKPVAILPDGVLDIITSYCEESNRRSTR